MKDVIPPARYTARPLEAEAMPFHDTPKQRAAIAKWGAQLVPAGAIWKVYDSVQKAWIPVRPGDLIVRAAGRFHPCPTGVFNATYDREEAAPV